MLPLLFDIRSAVSQLPDAFGTLEKLGVRLKSRRDAERFFALYSAFHNTTRMPCNHFSASIPPPSTVDVRPPWRGNLSKNLVAFCRRRLGFAFFLTKR